MQLDLTPRTFLGQLPDGAAGTRATLQIMGQLVQQFKSDPRIRSEAMQLLQGLPAKNWMAEIGSIFQYVRDGVRYTRDTRGVETIQTPTVTMDTGMGDCDDKSTLLASLLESVGHPTRFVAIGMQPGTYCHVYVQTQVGQKWVGLDPTEAVPVGWEPPKPAAVMILHN